MGLRNITVLGRAGSGKGTQIEILAKKLSPSLVLHTGSLFRDLAAKPTLIGQKLNESLREGELQPTWVASFLWLRELVDKFHGDQHLIFDGSPRRLPEAEEIDEVISWLGRGPLEAVLIDITKEEGVERLLKRARFDDTEKGIEERMEWFEIEVSPVIKYYEDSNRLIRVDGLGTIEEVTKRVEKALNL